MVRWCLGLLWAIRCGFRLLLVRYDFSFDVLLIVCAFRWFCGLFDVTEVAIFHHRVVGDDFREFHWLMVGHQIGLCLFSERGRLCFERSSRRCVLGVWWRQSLIRRPPSSRGMGRRRSELACVSNLCRFCVRRGGKLGLRFAFLRHSSEVTFQSCVWIAFVRLWLLLRATLSTYVLSRSRSWS